MIFKKNKLIFKKPLFGKKVSKSKRKTKKIFNINYKIKKIKIYNKIFKIKVSRKFNKILYV
ncbi:L28 family ribosomal protein [Candidatus Vidania fulgoroideorum]